MMHCQSISIYELENRVRENGKEERMSLWLKGSRQWNALMIFIINRILLLLLCCCCHEWNMQLRAEQFFREKNNSSSSSKRNRSSKFISYVQGAYSRQIGPLGVDWKIIREQYAFDTHTVCVCAVSPKHFICSQSLFRLHLWYAYAKGCIYSSPILSSTFADLYLVYYFWEFYCDVATTIWYTITYVCVMHGHYHRTAMKKTKSSF